MRGPGDERGDEQRSGAKDDEREPALLPERARIDGDGVAEQDEHERQRRDDAKRRRIEVDVDQPKSPGTECRTKREADRDLREAAPLSCSGTPRRIDCDDTAARN